MVQPKSNPEASPVTESPAEPDHTVRRRLADRFATTRARLPSLARRAADLAVVRPMGYVIRRLGFRQDVITRVHFQAAEDSAQYVLEHMMPCGVFDDRYPLFDLAASRAPAEGLLLEFGVFSGRSINYMAKRCRGRRLYGFDSFEGLAEDWAGTDMAKGRFNLGGVLPRVEPNVTLIKGWFDATLPKFLAEHTGPIAFAHLDADTFESTKYVLDRIVDRFRPGTIVQFDEYLGYPGWRHGEHRAWAMLCEQHAIEYRYLGVGWMSVGLEITAIG